MGRCATSIRALRTDWFPVSCTPVATAHRRRGVHEIYPAHAGHTRMKHLDQLPADGGNRAHLLGKAKGDGKLTFDKLTDLYHSGTKHEKRPAFPPDHP